MSMSFDWSEVEALAADLNAAGDRAETESGDAVGKVADDTKTAAQAAAPVDTGTLRASIDVTGSGIERTVEAGAPYAVFVEFGTSKMSPQPFMWPAADQAEQQLEEEMGRVGDPFD